MGENNGIYNINGNIFLGSFNMQQRLNIPQGFSGSGNENRFFSGFQDLGFCENLYNLHLADGTRNFGTQQGFPGNGHFIHSPVYHSGISGVHHAMGPFLDDISVKASRLDASFNYPVEVPRQELSSVYNGYNFLSSNKFEVNGRGDSLGSGMQYPYTMNAPVRKDYICGVGFSGLRGSEDVGVRDPFHASSRFSMFNERMSRETSSLGDLQALMTGYMGMESYSCRDDSVILAEAQKRMGYPQSSLGKSLCKKSALRSKVQHVETRENGLPQSIYQDDGAYGLGLQRDSWRSISCMAKTQLGCRLLQRKLNERKYQDVQLIFNDVINDVPELSLDPYGNYLVQKLLEVCNEEQITQVVLVIARNPGEGVRIGKSSHGTRVVQKIIQEVKTRQQIALVLKALETGFLDLITDVNGNHVLQQCLQCFSEEQNKFIFEGAAKFCAIIATNRYGCCVLNQCIAHSSRHYQEKLVTEICANGLLLAQDSFGNYVIQNILELKIPSAAVALLSALKGHFVLLSMQKSGSHVVEKCLRCCEQSRLIIIHELLSVSCFGQLLQHPFANYVIQSALQVTKGPARSLLVKALQPYKALNTNPYCKKIFSTNLLKK